MTPDALAAHLLAAGVTHRRLDGIPIHPDTPEEYGYILNNSGHKSWTTPESLPLLQQIIDRLSDRCDRPVLLKNPWDYAHFPLLAAHWPQARFIFLHRHPLRVIHSTTQIFRVMWQQQPDPYVLLLSARYGRLWASPLRRRLLRWLATGVWGLDVRAITRGVQAANHHYLAHKDTLSPRRQVVVRYEDLCTDPPAALQALLAALDQPAPQTAHPPRHGHAPLLPVLHRRQRQICQTMRPYLDHFGYSDDGENP